VAALADGTVYVGDGAMLRRVEGERRPARILEAPGDWMGLAPDGKGGLLATLAKGGPLVRIDLTRRSLEDVPTQGARLSRPRHLVVDRAGGAYVVEAPTSRKGAGGGLHYLAPGGRVTALSVSVPRLTGVALAPDERTLYAVGATSAEVKAFALTGPGQLGASRALCRLEAPPGAAPGCAGLTADAAGNLYLLNTALPAVEVVGPGGERRRSVTLPESPVACAVGGAPPALYVHTRHALHVLEISGP
jgi:sugar lactone lactonase YvrE